jgi:hypothetical protein
MRFAKPIAVAAGLLIAATVTAQEPKRQPPSVSAQTSAEKTIKALFKAEYARTSAADRRRLAERLLKNAAEEKHSTNQFVLLREARDLAAAGGDFPLALRAIQAADRVFEIDAPADTYAVMVTMMKPSGDAAALRRIAEIEALPDDNPARQQRLADRWFEAAQKEKPTTKILMYRRSVFWLRQCEPRLTGLEKEAIQKRIQDLATLVETADAKAGVFSLFEGRWEIKYANGVVGRYAIAFDGQVVNESANSKGRMFRRKGEILLDLNDGKLERIKISGSQLQVEHFNPASEYPKKVFVVGTATRLPD